MKKNFRKGHAKTAVDLSNRCKGCGGVASDTDELCGHCRAKQSLIRSFAYMWNLKGFHEQAVKDDRPIAHFETALAEGECHRTSKGTFHLEIKMKGKRSLRIALWCPVSQKWADFHISDARCEVEELRSLINPLVIAMREKTLTISPA